MSLLAASPADQFTCRLVGCGYITARRDGKKPHYAVGGPLVVDLIVLSRSLAADNASVLDCCPVILDDRE